MDDIEVKQATFEGWAVIEMMGHRKETGFVITQAFGQAVLFRVDVPELPERDYVLETPQYVDGRFCPLGTKVRRGASPARSCLIAPGSLYAINPCSEEAALKMIERSVARPLIILEIPDQPALPPAALGDEYEPDHTADVGGPDDDDGDDGYPI